MDLDDARRLALGLPHAHEAPHHHLTSFRVGTKIFATAPPDGHELRVFVDDDETRACVAEDPEVYGELWWGSKLSGLSIRLTTASPPRVAELLDAAWRRKATRRQITELDERSA